MWLSTHNKVGRGTVSSQRPTFDDDNYRIPFLEIPSYNNEFVIAKNSVFLVEVPFADNLCLYHSIFWNGIESPWGLDCRLKSMQAEYWPCSLPIILILTTTCSLWTYSMVIVLEEEFGIPTKLIRIKVSAGPRYFEIVSSFVMIWHHKVEVMGRKDIWDYVYLINITTWSLLLWWNKRRWSKSAGLSITASLSS